MASKFKGTSLQHFSEERLIKWRMQLQHLSQDSETAGKLFESVFIAQNQQLQLKAIKKIRPYLQQLTSQHEGDINNSLYLNVLEVLTEIHSVCDSRHPLQRAIVSIFQGLPKSEHEVLVKIVSANISAVFVRCDIYNEYSVDVGKKIEYLEALMENFKLGEMALKHQLPTVLNYCVEIIVELSQFSSASHSMGLLLAVLKAAANLMHKQAVVIAEMLSADSDSIVKLSFLNWLDHQENTPLGRRQWTIKQLSLLEVTCEHLMTEVDSIPHDVTVAVAMLLLVIFNINNSSCIQTQTTITKQCESSLSSKLQHWFSELKPRFAQLALCHGVLAKVPHSLLLETEAEGRPLLVTLFPKICKLFDSFTETSDRYLASRTIALWTSVTRDCSHCISRSSILYEYVLPSGEIMQKLLQLVWSLWEDPIDGIRHQCRDIFENTVKIYQELQNSGGSEDYLLTLANSLLSLESPTRGKFILLSSLSRHLSTHKFLKASPQLPSELMSVMGHQALACHAGDLWTSLVRQHWKELNTDAESRENNWNKTWVAPLVKAMCTAAPPARRHIVQHCLPTLFQCSINCMHHITVHLNSLESLSPDSKLTARLACLRCAKIECRDFDAAASVSFADLFATAMHHADEQIRLSALGLLCESHRTTEPPLPGHLKLLFQFVELNANSQSPGFRYPALTAFKKLFIRIRDSSYAMLKLHQKRRTEYPEAQITYFQTFLRELMDQQFKVLHPLSSYQRRSFSLSLLQLMASIFDEPNSSSASNPNCSISEESVPTIIPVFDFPSSITPPQARCLLDGLQDAFDANRSVCLELLLKLPIEIIGFTDLEFVHHQVSAYLRLVQSPKSVSCTTAAFQLKLYLQKCSSQFINSLTVLLHPGQVLNMEEKDAMPVFFIALNLLCKLLNQHISEAKKDLVKSTMSFPMYGVIQSIRAAYECLGAPTFVQHCHCHRDAMTNIVSICDDVAKLVSPVVCSSSPEGFLPNSDSQPLAQEHQTSLEVQTESSGNTLSVSGESAQSATPQRIAQSLLLCCWHSMKEIALLLGYLTEYAPVISDSSNTELKGVISHNQLDTIAKIFIHQLTEARHRGAFEMAYSGFSKLCCCLWSSSSPKLNQKPQKWVSDLLESLQSTSLARLLSITRRSAGLPFYLQAILTAEPAHTGRVCLKSTMETLLAVATESTAPRPCAIPVSVQETVEQPSSSNLSSQPAAVHALNILRALYRDSRLGEHIVPFIPQGVMIAIEGFSAPLWPVRNSSTLLFSALVTRIFGAKRVQDEHSMENKMTAKEFFTRFPTLHRFLLNQLEEGVRLMRMGNEHSLQPSLFPVLLLLSRLYPSPLDEANSPISMKPFLPLLLSCTGCSVWKTRVLIAHSITSMITEQNALNLLEDLYERMDLTNQNSLHCLLLVVEMIVRDRSVLLLRCSSTGEEEIPLSFTLLTFHLHKRLYASSRNRCGITKGVYLRVLLSLLELSASSLQNQSLRCQLGEVLTSCYQAIKSCCSGQLYCKELSIIQLKLLLKYFDSIGDLEIEGTKLLEPPSLLRMCLQDVYPLSLRTFCLEFINTTQTFGTNGDITDTLLTSLCSETDPDYLIQAYIYASDQIVSSSLHTTADLIPRACDLFLHRCNRLELRISIIHFLASALNCVDSGISSKFLGGLVTHLEAICIPTQPYEIREAVAQELPHLWSACFKSYCEKELVPVSSRLAFNLLQDSDIDVRMCAASSVAKLLPAAAGLSVESPNPSSAMVLFIESIPTMIADPNLALSTLLCLVPNNLELLPDASSNPLFNEDAVNEYAEDVVILQHVTNCISRMINTHKEFPHHFISDCLTPLVTKDEQYSPVNISIWENPRQFMKLVREHYLRSVLEDSSRCSSTSVTDKMEISALSRVHPIFI